MDPESDLAALDELFDLVAECDGHRPIGEHKYLDLLQPDNGGGGLVGEVDGELVAYLAVGYSSETNTCAIEVALHPLHRQAGHFGRIVDAGVEHARARGADMVRMWAFQPNYVEVLLDMGFDEERELRQVRRPLPYPGDSEFPAGFELATFRPGVDEEAWLAVNNAAFAGHPENGGWTAATLEQRRGLDWFDPGGVLLAWRGERLLGFHWTKWHGHDSDEVPVHEPVGEVYVLAVDPEAHGTGLGRGLLRAGLAHLHDRGCRVAVLYVDSASAPAAGLYRSEGFSEEYREVCYQAVIPPAPAQPAVDLLRPA